MPAPDPVAGPPVARLEVLLDALAARAAGPSRLLVGLTGAPGAGKSTLAAAARDGLTARGVPTAVVAMDGFHLADVQLDRLGRRDRKGAPDTFDAAGYVALLRRLRAGGDTVYAPGFDRDLEQPLAGAVDVGQDVRVVLTEGNYLLLDGPWAPVAGLLDEIWYVEVDDELRRDRLRARHVRFGKSPQRGAAWVDAVDEPNARLVAAGRCRATVVVPGG